MHPQLDIEFYLDLPGDEGEPASLIVHITNKGRVAATDIHGWIHIEAEKLGPYVPPPRPPRRSDPLMDLTRYSIPRTKTSWGSIFDDDQEPEDGFYEAQVYENDKLLPSVYREFSIELSVRAKDKAKIRYHIVSAEGADIEGTIEINLLDGTEIRRIKAGERFN